MLMLKVKTFLISNGSGKRLTQSNIMSFERFFHWYVYSRKVTYFDKTKYYYFSQEFIYLFITRYFS